jgi:hypothetical protein
MNRSISIVIHGESGVGKSWLGDTAPGPRLILDAEGGSRFTPSPKVAWDPVREEVPTGLDPDTSVIVVTRDFETVRHTFAALNTGQHEFESVVWDSLTEIQRRCLDAIAGIEQPTQQDWGALLRQMEAVVRAFRDLTFHPIKPLQMVAYISLSRMVDGVWRPNVQGQLATSMPQYVDVVGYLYTKTGEDGHLQRNLMTAPYTGFAAKDRTNKLGENVPAPNLTEMMEVIYP